MAYSSFLPCEGWIDVFYGTVCHILILVSIARHYETSPQKYGGMDPQMAKQLRELEKENARLKRLVANQALDMEILKEAARPN